MIGRLRAFVLAHWPALRLRTILLAVLLFAAVLPGLSAIFLRVYENTLVRQTEAELIAQTAAIAAMAEAMWPGAEPIAVEGVDRTRPGYYRPEAATIDLGSTPILPARPDPRAASRAPDPNATAVSGRLAPVMERTSQTTLASIVLLDGRGAILRSVGGETGNWGFLPEVRSALDGEARTVLRRNDEYRPRYSMEWLSRASGLRIHHARPVMVNGEVVAVVLTSRSPRALFRGIYQDRIKIALGVIGTLGLIAFLAVLVSRGIARPIERLSRAARDVATGGGDLPPAPPTAAIEIRTLYEDFDAMSRAVERRGRYLKDFAAAVSHEFKTPLAGIQGAVELLQDHDDMEPERRRRFLDNIAADGRRLSALVTRLMDLARADMARPEAGLVVDPVRPVAKAVDARADRLKIDNRLDRAPAVAVPASTLEMVVSTLLENSRQAGAASVVISAERRGGELVLMLADDGPGVPKADRERVFEPFFTTRRGEGGAGLGLSIALALLAANQARLDLASSPKGAVFEIRLPIAERTA